MLLECALADLRMKIVASESSHCCTDEVERITIHEGPTDVEQILSQSIVSVTKAKHVPMRTATTEIVCHITGSGRILRDDVHRPDSFRKEGLQLIGQIPNLFEHSIYSFCTEIRNAIEVDWNILILVMSSFWHICLRDDRDEAEEHIKGVDRKWLQ